MFEWLRRAWRQVTATRTVIFSEVRFYNGRQIDREREPELWQHVGAEMERQRVFMTQLFDRLDKEDLWR